MYSGDFDLKIDNVWGTRHEWKDGKHQRLEHVLNQVIEELIRAALLEQEREAERERKRLADEERQRQREEEEQRRREERARVKRFARLAEASELHDRLRAFVRKLREAVGPAESDPHLTDWLPWAETYVASLDPLRRFRNRKETLKLYFPIYEYQVQKVLSHGVEGGSTNEDDDKELPPAVTLYDVPVVYTSGYAAAK